jgi:hypothetical protein
MFMFIYLLFSENQAKRLPEIFKVQYVFIFMYVYIWNENVIFENFVQVSS